MQQKRASIEDKYSKCLENIVPLVHIQWSQFIIIN